MRSRSAKVGAVGLLFLWLLSCSNAVALTLPPPPDTSASANDQNGQLRSFGQQSFSGGVFLVKDGSIDQNVSANEEVAQFFCAAGTYSVNKEYKTEIGESISGPISKEQASGIVEAIDFARSPKTVSLSMNVESMAYGFGNMTYKLTGITYNVTTYSVWITTQQSPAMERRVGYIVVGIPKQMQVTRISDDFAGAFCPPISFTELGPGFRPDPLAWLYRPLIPPDGGVAPIFTYGRVTVLSEGGIAGAAVLRPGENATFLLPRGNYSAVAEVNLLGLQFSVGTEAQSSPVDSKTLRFTVWLTTVEYFWYGLELIGLVILLAVVWMVGERFGIWSVLANVSTRALRSIHDRIRPPTQSWGGLARLQPAEAPSTGGMGIERRADGKDGGGSAGVHNPDLPQSRTLSGPPRRRSSVAVSP